MNAPLLSLLRRFTVRYYSSDWLRGVLTLLGVGLGLSVLVAILIANRTALASFQTFTRTVGGKASLTLAGNGSPLDETVLQRLDWARGQARFAPLVRGSALVPGPKEQILELTGVDLLQDWQFPESAATSTNPHIDFMGLLVAPDAVIVADTLASRLGVRQDGHLKLVINGRTHALHVAFVFPTKGQDSFDDSVILMDIAAAQELLDRAGTLDRVDVLLQPGVDRDEFFKRARSSLPADVSIEPPSVAHEQAQKMTQAFQLNLTALSMVALMVGMFLIYNTVAISVVRRRPEIGIMRALGADRGQMFALFLLEGGFLGAIGSLLGLLFGVVLSRSAVQAVTQTVDLLYVPTRAREPSLEPWIASACVVLGCLMALAASWLPAAEASSVPPVEAMGRGAQNLLHRPRLLRVSAIALAFFLLAPVASMVPPLWGIPFGGYVGCLFILLGCAAFSPLVVWLVTHLLKGPMVALLGASSMAATSHLLGSLKRIGVAVGALTVGMAMVASVGIMIHSFRETVVQWIQDSVKADIFITSAENQSTIAEGRIPEEAVRIISAMPGVKGSDLFLGRRITYEGEPAYLGASTFDVLGRDGHLSFRRGSSAEILASCVNTDRVVISETFATRHHLSEGDAVTLQSPHGPASLTVAGVYYDYTSESGWVVMDRPTYARWFEPPGVTNLALFLDPGVDPDRMRQAIRDKMGSRFVLHITTSGHLRSEVVRLFDRTFAVTRSIEIIAIVVAVLGVATTLLALIIERRKEIAILRCIGATRGQVTAMVLLEAATIGLAGAILGLIGGTLLSLILIQVINKQSFGWTIIMQYPWTFLAQVLALILGATLASAIYPAIMAGRVEPAANLRNE